MPHSKQSVHLKFMKLLPAFPPSPEIMEALLALRISIILSLALTVLCLGACGEKEPELEPIEVTAGTPNYADDKQIELSAYCGPRRAGYRYWNGYYGEHPEDPKEGWNGWITKEDVFEVSEVLKKNQYGQYLKDVLDGKYQENLY